jgi:hypothetical protein
VQVTFNIFAAAAFSEHADAIVVATAITSSFFEIRRGTSVFVSFSDDALAGGS